MKSIVMFLHAIVLKSKAMLFVDNYEKCGEQHNFGGGDMITEQICGLCYKVPLKIFIKFRTYRIHL